jgi:hypothetical protein
MSVAREGAMFDFIRRVHDGVSRIMLDILSRLGDARQAYIVLLAAIGALCAVAALAAACMVAARIARHAKRP